MKLRLLIILVLFGILFLTACENIDVSKLSDADMQRIANNTIKCDSPYIRFETGCCLDTDNNKICDKDEIKQDDLSIPKNKTIDKQEETKEVSEKSQTSTNEIQGNIIKEPDCKPYASKKCVNNNLYWFDSCNNMGDKAEECSNGCNNDECILCKKEYEERCYSGNLYWFDSCNNREDKVENCPNGCSNDECILCEDNYKEKCYSGDLYWYNSCDKIGDKAKDCPNGCNNDECKSCDDECSDDLCSGNYFYECLTDSNGCKYKESRGIVKNKCGVECETDDDCTATKDGLLRPIKTEECSLYVCKSRGCDIWNDERAQIKERISDLQNGAPPSSEYNSASAEVTALTNKYNSRSC